MFGTKKTTDAPLFQFVIDEDIELGSQSFSDRIGLFVFSHFLEFLTFVDQRRHEGFLVIRYLRRMRRFGIRSSAATSGRTSRSPPIGGFQIPKGNPVGTPFLASIVDVNSTGNEIGLNAIGDVELTTQFGFQTFGQHGVNVGFFEIRRVFAHVGRAVVVVTVGTKIDGRTTTVTASASAIVSTTTTTCPTTRRPSRPPRQFSIEYGHTVIARELITNRIGGIVISFTFGTDTFTQQTIDGIFIDVGSVSRGVTSVIVTTISSVIVVIRITSTTTILSWW
mmetsp:Transcript_21144/g.32323  ORF Transcript_21144/g.32323 Transcript_21144/m.32323 type:complete len:279 (+) Transcript_21144:759-1595(+)